MKFFGDSPCLNRYDLMGPDELLGAKDVAHQVFAAGLRPSCAHEQAQRRVGAPVIRHGHFSNFRRQESPSVCV